MITAHDITIDVFHNATLFPGGKRDKTRKRHLSAALEHANHTGLILEFGVFQGYTLNALAEWCRDHDRGFDPLYRTDYFPCSLIVRK